MVGGADGACSLPACLAKMGSESEAEFDRHNAGTADKRQYLEI